jgi:hypothetical protein
MNHYHQKNSQASQTLDDIRAHLMHLFKDYSKTSIKSTHREHINFNRDMDEMGLYKPPVLNAEESLQAGLEEGEIWSARRFSEELSILLFKLDCFEEYLNDSRNAQLDKNLVIEHTIEHVQSWDEVNDFISLLREKAGKKLGKDYSGSEFDV